MRRGGLEPSWLTSSATVKMEEAGDGELAFPCGQCHDKLIRVLLPHSRNVIAVEGMMEAEASRGQMTPGTLGFSP